MKKGFRLAAGLLALVLALSGCGLIGSAKAKDFTKAGLTITLTEAFVEKEHISFTSVYESPSIAVVVLKEEFSIVGGDDYTLFEYADLVIDANNLDAISDFYQGLVYFSYETSANGKDYSYTATVFQGSDAYWLVQFGCETDKVADLIDTIFSYAQTVICE